jgi:hypothetical protein
VAVQETGVAVNSPALLHVALWSSVAIMLCFCAVGVSMLSLFVYKVGKEWRYAIQCRVQISREERRKSMLGPYRVRARNARSRATPDCSPQQVTQNEAVEPHTIAIITRFFGGVFYMPMRQCLLIYTSYIELLFCRCGLCRCEVLEEVLQQQHHAAQPLHHDSVSFWVL